MRESPTLSDIARRAGVSSMTVSLALRGDMRVASATRQRIQHLAVEMKYRVNPLVSALMASVRSKRQISHQTVIAFAVERSNMTRPTLQQYLSGAHRRADELGFKLEVFNYGAEAMSVVRLNAVLYARGIVGVLMAPLFEPGQLVDIEWKNYSAAALGYSMPAPPLHRVVNHQFHSMRLALERLQELGYRRPGLAIRKSDDDRVDHNWIAGYLTHCHVNRIPHLPLLVTDDWKQTTFACWFKAHRPDVVVSLESLDYDVSAWMKASGMQIPRNVGFAVVNREPTSSNVAGVDQSSAAVGATAVDVIVAQLHRNERGIPAEPRVTLVEGQWVEGATVRRQGA